MKPRTRAGPLARIRADVDGLAERIRELGTAAPRALESGDDASHSAVDLEDQIEALRRRLDSRPRPPAAELRAAVDELRRDVEAAFARIAVPAHDPRPG